jgi:hypothetical protein
MISSPPTNRPSRRPLAEPPSAVAPAQPALLQSSAAKSSPRQPSTIQCGSPAQHRPAHQVPAQPRPAPKSCPSHVQPTRSRPSSIIPTASFQPRSNLTASSWPRSGPAVSTLLRTCPAASHWPTFSPDFLLQPDPHRPSSSTWRLLHPSTLSPSLQPLSASLWWT